MTVPPDAVDAPHDAAARAAIAPWPLRSRLGGTAASADTDCPCELEGSPGHVVPIRLRELCLDEHLARIRIPPAWHPLDLPLARITSLRLRRAEVPPHTEPADCALTLLSGTVLHLHVLALTEHPLGLFLLLPRSDPGGWEYRCYPREAWRHVVQGQALALDACDSPDGLRQALRDTPPGHPAPRVDALRYPVDAELLRRVGYERARALGVLPLGRLDGTVVAVVDDPTQRGPLRELGFLLDSRVVAVRASGPSTAELIHAVYDQHRLAPATWFDRGVD